MRNFRKIITALVVVFTLGSVIAYSHISKSKASKNTTINNSSSSVKTVSNNKETAVEPHSKDTDTITPSSADIIIYNSHYNETYPSGAKITSISTSINDKLIKEGLKSAFIKYNPPVQYVKSYESTRNLIKDNVKNYENKILLDIHRAEVKNPKANKKEIQIELSKSNPHFKTNKEFANRLCTEINKSKKVKCSIVEFNKGILCFNQDLSTHAILIELGNNLSSNADVEVCSNVLVSALKVLQK